MCCFFSKFRSQAPFAKFCAWHKPLNEPLSVTGDYHSVPSTRVHVRMFSSPRGFSFIFGSAHVYYYCCDRRFPSSFSPTHNSRVSAAVVPSGRLNSATLVHPCTCSGRHAIEGARTVLSTNLQFTSVGGHEYFVGYNEIQMWPLLREGESYTKRRLRVYIY